MTRGKTAVRSSWKLVVLLLALVLLAGGMIGGTVAWLIANPAPVVNTFTYGDINIELNETDTKLDNDGEATTNEYKMMPGQSIKKDPIITVKADSEEMWLFVKLEKSANFDTFMEYTVDSGWTALSGVDGVYYIHVGATSNDLQYQVIQGNTVTVKETVTKDQLNALDSGSSANYPTLTVTAYAVQYVGNATAADAWSRVETTAATPANP